MVAVYLCVSFSVSVFTAYTALNAIEIYRTHTDAKVKRFLLFLFALNIGGGSIWCMHFIAMLTLKTEGADTMPVYDVPLTIISWCLAVAFVYAGAFIAAKDDFFGASEKEGIEIMKQRITMKAMMKNRNHLKFLTLFLNPKYFILGGVAAGFGVGCMHYLGILAIRNFDVEFQVEFIFISCILAVVVAAAGFWITFRFLHWRPSLERLRILASVVIAVGEYLFKT